MKLGIDIILTKERHLVEGCKVGLLANQASIDSAGRHAVDIFGSEKDIDLQALFGPEHGIATKAQDMEPVASFDFPDYNRKLPIYSLYGDSFESLTPTDEMLSNIDVLVIDLQDVGSRYYTYVWTAVLCMKACAKRKKRVVILDRPNPINGVDCEGALQEKGFESFVGLHRLPIRHAMTIGEIASYINDKEKIGADLHIVKMEGWNRQWFWRDTNLKWVNPSPNMRSFNAALLYPGMCLVEGTNMSEGRGTDTPFEIVGAPYIDSENLIYATEKLNLPGVKLAPTSFIPTMQKWTGAICNGVRWTITDEKAFRPYLTGLAFIWAAHRLYKKDGFAWRKEKYEFVSDKPAIDLLTGSSFFRENIDKGFDELRVLAEPSAGFAEKRSKALLY